MWWFCQQQKLGQLHCTQELDDTVDMAYLRLFAWTYQYPVLACVTKQKTSQLVLTGCPAPKSFTGTVRERDPFWPSCCIIWPTSLVAPLVEERSLATEDEHLHMSSYRYRSWN
nr:uncharacterized protein LOC119179873 [Rhipicephalus microplus]